MTDLAAIEALAPAWRELADGAARAPLDSPDWLLPIARRYLRNEELRFLTWWAADQLVGVAPLTLVVKRLASLPARRRHHGRRQRAHLDPMTPHAEPTCRAR